jgi:hypothetical protein
VKVTFRSGTKAKGKSGVFEIWAKRVSPLQKIIILCLQRFFWFIGHYHYTITPNIFDSQMPPLEHSQAITCKSKEDNARVFIRTRLFVWRSYSEELI